MTPQPTHFFLALVAALFLGNALAAPLPSGATYTWSAYSRSTGQTYTQMASVKYYGTNRTDSWFDVTDNGTTWYGATVDSAPVFWWNKPFGDDAGQQIGDPGMMTELRIMIDLGEPLRVEYVGSSWRHFTDLVSATPRMDARLYDEAGNLVHTEEYVVRTRAPVDWEPGMIDDGVTFASPIAARYVELYVPDAITYRYNPDAAARGKDYFDSALANSYGSLAEIDVITMPIPEPATLSLGLLGIVILGSRRQKGPSDAIMGRDRRVFCQQPSNHQPEMKS